MQATHPALCFLRLVGSRNVTRVSAALALQAVCKWWTPALEKLDIVSVDDGLAPVGRALGEGKLPRLKTLGLSNCHLDTGHVGDLLAEMRASPMALWHLVLALMEFSAADVQCLAEAVQDPSGGICALEDFTAFGGESGALLDPVLNALASGRAPCAKTLVFMEVGGHRTYITPAVQRFFGRALGGGLLPSLTKLVLYMKSAGPDVWHMLVAAFSSLTRRGSRHGSRASSCSPRATRGGWTPRASMRSHPSSPWEAYPA